MRTAVKECGHCGIEYSYYFSGTSTPEYNSENFCNSCEEARVKAISIAFASIPRLFEYRFIPTDKVSLEELKAEEKSIALDNDEYMRKAREKGQHLLPMARRIWATTYNVELGESYVYSQVKYKGELYSYRYYPSKMDDVEIKVKKKINLKTGKIA